MNKSTKDDEPEFDQIQLHNKLNAGQHDESTKEHFLRKVKSNPFVPLGALATTMALFYGLWSFRQGDHKMSQYMMRARVVAQGFTLIAVIAGLALSAIKTD